MKTQKLAVGDRMRLVHEVNGFWAEVHEKGVVSEAKEGHYTVKLDHGLTVGGLTDDEIEAVHES